MAERRRIKELFLAARELAPEVTIVKVSHTGMASSEV